MNGELDPERALTLAYVAADARPSVAALWRLDARLGEVVAASREPALGMIKLAWWREQLAALSNAARPEDPALADLHDDPKLRRMGSEIAEIELGWAAVMAGAKDAEALVLHASERGARLFALTAGLLAPDEAFDVGAAGERWALVDLAMRGWGKDPLKLAGERWIDRTAPGWPTALRALGMLDALARRDITRGTISPPGSPARVLRMMWHRASGR